MNCSTSGSSVFHYLPEFTQIHVHWVNDANLLIPCHSLLLLPLIFPRMRVFSNESVLCSRWRKYWSFSFSISPSNEYSGLISFRIDLFDLAVQGTLKSLLQHQNSRASVLQCSAFFMVHISPSYMTTGKTIVLTIQTLLAKWCFCFLIHCPFPGSSERNCLPCRISGFSPWVGKIPQRREWQPTPVFLPRQLHGQRSLADYTLWGRKESDTPVPLTHTIRCLGLS